MLREDKYSDTLTDAQLWQRYCGFLDLSIGDFMNIQKELLLDQIERIANSVLGKKIMGSGRPKTIDEFRKSVPLTTYDDYEPYLSDKREDALAVKPQWWCHSAGRGGRFKWTPQSTEVFEKCVKGYLAAFILSTASRKGEINIRPGFRLLATIAPPPYTSGYIMTALKQGITFKLIPPLEDVEQSFHERIKKGFAMALRDGVDIMGDHPDVCSFRGIRTTQGIGEQLTADLHFKPSGLYRRLHRLNAAPWHRRFDENRRYLVLGNEPGQLLNVRRPGLRRGADTL